MQSIRIVMIVIACLLCHLETIPALGQLTITTPKESEHAEQVRQVSLSRPAPPMLSDNGASAKHAASTEQIRVRLQFLEVDSTTRAAIYAGLGPGSVFTSTNPPRWDSQDWDAQDWDSRESNVESMTNFPNRSISQSRSSALVTQAILTKAEVAGILKMAEAANHSVVADSPNLMLLNDRKMELTDMVQRPFIVNHQKQGDTIQPIIEHVSEGTRLGIIAKVEKSPDGIPAGFAVGCEFVSQKITQTRSGFLFGLGNEPFEVQIPHLHVTKARATAKFPVNQTLLFDPHVTSTRVIRNETGVPILEKIPYLGRSFRNVDVTEQEQHVIVLLQPESIP